MIFIPNNITVGTNLIPIVTGVQSLSKLLTPLGVIFPDGMTAQETKKIEKEISKFSSTYIFDNIATPGFFLLEQRYNSKDWLVFDPRGVITPISNKCISRILQYTAIINGQILDQCIWIRDDEAYDMWLCVCTDPMFELYNQNTTAINNKPKFSDIKIGDHVKCQNGVEGEYLGIVNYYSHHLYGGSSKDFSPATKMRQKTIRVRPGVYYINKDISVLSVTKANSNSNSNYNRDYGINIINNDINTLYTIFYNDPTLTYGGNKFTYATKSILSPVISFEEITADELKTEISNIYSEFRINYAVTDENNDSYVIEDTRHVRYIKHDMQFLSLTTTIDPNITYKSISYRKYMYNKYTIKTPGELFIDGRKYYRVKVTCVP